MTIKPIGEPKIIMSNPGSMHCYFGWPSVVKLQNGKIAAVASGYRLAHVCPFGKVVIAYSEDNGETYTAPTPIIDTVLDDRDAGIMTFGDTGVVVTSFNNTTEFQRKAAFARGGEEVAAKRAYSLAYLDLVAPEAEQAVLGSTYCISNDCGVTFGPLMHSPIMTPHGPALLKDGTMLYVGRPFVDEGTYTHAYRMYPDGTMEKLGEIDDVYMDGKRLLSCEPHAIELPDGRFICHIRVQGDRETRVFTTYQSVSEDGGKTWSKPEPLLSQLGGAPAHLVQLSNGLLISVYGYRQEPYGLRVMVSADGGKTWEKDLVLVDGYPSGDLGYPATIELDDGTLLTVYYARPEAGSPAVILQQKWKLV